MDKIYILNEIKDLPPVENSLYIFDFDETLFINISGLTLPMIKGDIDFINKLHEKATIMILTARDVKFSTKTIQIIKRYKMKYDYLIFDENKGDAVKKFLYEQREKGKYDGLNLFRTVFFIDNLIENCEDVKKINPEVHCYLIKPTYQYVNKYFSQ